MVFTSAVGFILVILFLVISFILIGKEDNKIVENKKLKTTKFVKIGDVVINVDMICAITNRYERIHTPDVTTTLPFNDYSTVKKGVNVFLGTALDDSFIPFPDETLESILDKLNNLV